jgi:hypothetical protein
MITRRTGQQEWDQNRVGRTESDRLASESGGSRDPGNGARCLDGWVVRRSRVERRVAVAVTVTVSTVLAFCVCD